MKAIILAGGAGTRLYPVTLAINKHLLPVYNKPMIYYPLSTVMLAGIRDVLLISTPAEISRYRQILGSGDRFGIRISYEVQDAPRGVAEAFIIGEKFIGNDSVFLILGDNIFYGSGFTGLLQGAVRQLSENGGAMVFVKPVSDPHRYGVLDLGNNGEVVRVVEKPADPPSNLAVTGMYLYDNEVIDIAKELSPSDRGELEITDVNNKYLELGRLDVSVLPRGVAWFDAGTCDSLRDASNFIATIERRQGIMVGCPEEIAYRNGWISRQDLVKYALMFGKTEYGKYLLRLAEGEDDACFGDRRGRVHRF